MKLSRPLILNSLRSQMDAPLRLVIAGLAMLVLYTFTSGAITLNGTPLAGTGTWTLAGTNSYTGPTTVNGGTLVLTNAATLSSNSVVTITNGAVLNLGFAANNQVGALVLNGTSVDIED